MELKNLNIMCLVRCIRLIQYLHAGSMSTLHQHDVTCSVCLNRKRSVVKMLPGQKNGQEISEILSQESQQGPEQISPKYTL